MFNAHPTLWEVYLQKKYMEINTAITSGREFLGLLSIAVAPGVVIGINGPPESGKSFILALVALINIDKKSTIIGTWRILSIDSEGGFPDSHLLAKLAQKYIPSVQALDGDSGSPRVWLEVQNMDEFYVSFIKALRQIDDWGLVLIDSLTRLLSFSAAPKGVASKSDQNTLSAHLRAVSCLLRYAAKELGHFVLNLVIFL